MHDSTRLLAPLFLLAAGASGVLAQEAVPTTQPGLLTIFQEVVKPGREAAHAAHEAGWPAAFAKAGTPEVYLALESLTGPSMVWYTSPYESYAKEGEAMARNQADPVLSAEQDRLWREDAQYLESTRTVQLVARPDLSHGDFPNIATERFWDITTFRIRPGHERQFEEAATLYGEIAARVAPDLSFRVYMVVAGMPGGTFMVFSSVDEYGDFDQMMAADNSVFSGMTDDEQGVFETFSLEASQSTITHRFRLHAGMSYVDDATRAADPAFWGRE